MCRTSIAGRAGRFFFLGLSVLGLCIAPPGTPQPSAAETTWTGADSTSPTDFEVGNNWTAGVPANNLFDDTAVFGLKGSLPNPALTMDREIYGIDFQNTGWTLGGADYTLTVGAGGINTTHTTTSTSTIQAKVALGASATWTVSTVSWRNHTLTLSGGLSSQPGQTLIIANPAWYNPILDITGPASLAGDVIIRGPNLKVANYTADSITGNLQFDGGLLMVNADLTRDLGTGAGEIQFTSARIGGFTNYGNSRITITIGDGAGGVADLTWGTAGFNPSALTLAGRSAGTGGITFVNPIDLNRTSSGMRMLYNYGGANYTAELTGVISNSGAGAAGIDQHNNSTGVTYLANNANTFNGPIAVRGGGLRFDTIGNIGSGPSALGNPTTAADALITLGGYHLTGIWYTGTLVYSGSDTVTTDRPIRLGGHAAIRSTGTGAITFTADMQPALHDIVRTFTLGGTSTGDNTFAGRIVDFSAEKPTSVVKAHAGTWVLSGDNTYTGTTNVEAGTLIVTHPEALGSSAPDSGTTVAAGAVVRVQGGITVAEPITVTGSGINWSGALQNAAGNNEWSGPITFSGYARVGVAGGTVFTLSGGVNGSNAHFGSQSGVIRIVDNPINVGPTGTVTALNNSTVELNVGGNTWRNTIMSNGGTLKLGLEDAIPTTAIVSVGGTNNTNGTFDLNGHNQTIAGLRHQGTGTALRVVNSGSGTPTLTVNNTDEYTYGGVLGIAGQAALNLTKRGDGTLTLSGANAYTGLTTIEGGTLKLGHSHALGATTTGTVVNAGGTLDLNGFDTGEPITLDGGTLRNSVATSPITSLNGTLTLASQSEIHTPAALSLVGRITGPGGLTKTGSAQIRLYDTANDYQGPTIIQQGYVDLIADEVIPDTSDVTLNAYLNLRGRTETVRSLAGNTSGFLYSNPGVATFRIGAGDGSGSYAGRILDNGGQVSIVKIGEGTQVFTGTNNIYTGTTSVEAGTLLVNGTHTGGGAYTVQNGATLGGTGTIGGAATVHADAFLAPGASIGMLTFSDDLALLADSTLLWEFREAGTAGDDYDSITGPKLILPAAGRVNLSIDGLDGYHLSAGDSFTLFHGDVFEHGASEPFAFGTNLNDYFEISATFNWWGDWEVTAAGSLVLTAVPEPGTWLMLMCVLAFGLLVRRRQSQHAS